MLTRVPAHACTRTHTCTWSQACALTHASFPLWMCGGPSPLSAQTVAGGAWAVGAAASPLTVGGNLQPRQLLPALLTPAVAAPGKGLRTAWAACLR